MSLYIKRNLYMPREMSLNNVKRGQCIHVNRDVLTCQKRPIHVKRDPSMHVKRDVSIHAKRPLSLSLSLSRSLSLSLFLALSLSLSTPHPPLPFLSRSLFTPCVQSVAFSPSRAVTCVAACCSALQHVAVSCFLLQCVMQCVAVCCSVLQLQCVTVCCSVQYALLALHCRHLCYGVLQRVAMFCIVLQHVAVCSSPFLP